MTSEARKSQSSDSTPDSTNQAIPESSTEKNDGNFHRRSLLKGATMAAATLGTLGGLALPGGALPAHAAAATPRTSSVRLSPKDKKPDSFKFSLEDSTAQQFAGGTVKTATSADIEELTALSLFSESIEPGAMHELHWHPNAHELAYCLSGQGEIGIFFTGAANAIFPIQPGSVSFIPTGATHYIRNTGSDVLRMITAFSHEDPEHIDFSDTLGFFPHNVLSETFGLAPQGFPTLPQQGDQFLVNVGQVPPTTPVSTAGPFTANFKDIAPEVSGGGTVTQLSTKLIPSLDKITLFILQAQPGAVREPHWHQNANELNYCVQGNAQFQIFAPDEHREDFPIKPGDVSFIPQNYFHAITNTSNEPLTLLIFFSNNTVSHIDLSQVMGFFPRELFAASFGSDLHIFDNIPNVGDVSIAPKV